MIDAVRRNGGIAFCLRQYESTLQHSLCMQREATCGPFGAYTVTLDGFGYVGLDLRGVAADAGLASLADGRADFVDSWTIVPARHVNSGDP